MRTLALTLLTSLAAFTATGQSTFRQAYGAFTGLAVNSGIELVVVEGSAHAIALEGPKDAIEALEVVLEDGTLKVGFKRNSGGWMSWGNSYDGVSGTVTMARLESVIANGGAEVESAVTWQAERFKAIVNGGAEVALKLDGAAAKVIANGGAEIALRGRVTEFDVMANGGAEIAAGDLIAESVKVSANGGAEVVVHASRSLKASANGAAEVAYAGGAKSVDVSTNGGASVSPRG